MSPLETREAEHVMKTAKVRHDTEAQGDSEGPRRQSRLVTGGCYSEDLSFPTDNLSGRESDRVS